MRGFPVSYTHLDVYKRQLLSLLRAYFTAKYLNEHFSDFDDNNLLENRIIWEIKGDGIDQSDKENRLKRRVYLVINVDVYKRQD